MTIYKYQGTDPHEWTNAAVRLAMTLPRPIIYLCGVAPGLYEPIFPCYVVGDDPARLEFRLAADVTKMLICTACGLVSTVAAITAPCSVKTRGR